MDVAAPATGTAGVAGADGVAGDRTEKHDGDDDEVDGDVDEVDGEEVADEDEDEVDCWGQDIDVLLSFGML